MLGLRVGARRCFLRRAPARCQMRFSLRESFSLCVCGSTWIRATSGWRSLATLATRPEKQVRSLADLTREWRQRASRVLGKDANGWARTLTASTAQVPRRVLRADDVPLDVVREVGQTVMETVGEKRSTWTRWNLHAEASRQLMGWRFASIQDREAITGLVVDAAEHASLRLTPPELASSPLQFRRTDGTSRFRPHPSTLFSSEVLLAAEDRLLARR